MKFSLKAEEEKIELSAENTLSTIEEGQIALLACLNQANKGDSLSHMIFATLYGGENIAAPLILIYFNQNDEEKDEYCNQYQSIKKAKLLTKNDAAAFYWYKRASEAQEPCPEAMVALAVMFEKGIGVAADIGKAAFYYYEFLNRGWASSNDEEILSSWLSNLHIKNPNHLTVFYYFALHTENLKVTQELLELAKKDNFLSLYP